MLYTYRRPPLIAILLSWMMLRVYLFVASCSAHPWMWETFLHTGRKGDLYLQLWPVHYFKAANEWISCCLNIISVQHLPTHQAQRVVTSEEFGFPFSIVKLFKAHRAVWQIIALLFYSIHLLLAIKLFPGKELKWLTLKPIQPDYNVIYRIPYEAYWFDCA